MRSQPALFQASKPAGLRLPKAKSHLEEDFAMQCQFEDLPEPTREFRFAAELGRKYRFDFAWPDRKIAVECEGGIFIAGRHNRPISMEGDMAKYNLAVLLGWRVGRFSRRMIASGDAARWVIELFIRQS